MPALGFDRLTALYDSVVRLTTRETETKRRLLDQAALAPGERILDLGCGTGTLSIQAKRHEPAAELSALDGDPAVLERARRKADADGVPIRFDEALADRMPYPDRAFDKVLSSLFFHHLDREAKERAMREIARVLRPGGQLHVADWGPPRGLLGPALFLAVRLLDGFDTTADNAAGRLPEVFAGGGLTTVRGRGRLQTPLGTIAFVSGERPGLPSGTYLPECTRGRGHAAAQAEAPGSRGDAPGIGSPVRRMRSAPSAATSTTARLVHCDVLSPKARVSESLRRKNAKKRPSAYRPITAKKGSRGRRRRWRSGQTTAKIASEIRLS